MIRVAMASDTCAACNAFTRLYQFDLTKYISIKAYIKHVIHEYSYKSTLVSNKTHLLNGNLFAYLLKFVTQLIFFS